MSKNVDYVTEYPEAFASLGATVILTSWTQAFLGMAVGHALAVIIVTIPAAWIVCRAAPNWPGDYDD